MEIVYCDKCGHRIPENEMQSGTVLRHDNNVYCSKCVASGAASALVGVAETTAIAKEDVVQVPPTPRPERAPSRTNIPATRRDGPPTPVPTALITEPTRRSALSSQKLGIIVFGIAMGAALAIVVLVVSSFESLQSNKNTVAVTENPPALPSPLVPTAPTAPTVPSPPNNSPQTPNGPTDNTPTPATPEIKPEIKPDPTPTAEHPAPPSGLLANTTDMREEAATAHLERAKKYRQDNPAAIRFYRVMLQRLLLSYAQTKAGQEAIKLLAESPTDPLPDASPSSSQAAWKKAIDFMPLLDLKKDAIGSKWTVKDGAIASDGGARALVQLPYHPPVEYDFKMVFSCQSKDGTAAQVLVGDKRQFAWVLSGSNLACGFGRVSDHAYDENATTLFLPEALKPQQQYTSIVEVRKNGVRAFLDGKLMAEHKSNYSDMAPDWHWSQTGDLVLVAGIHTPGILHKLEVLEITGKGKPTRPLLPAVAVATNSAAQEKAKLQNDYENTVAEAYTLALHGSREAVAKLEALKNNARFAPLTQAIAFDCDLLRAGDELRKARLEGLAALTDKRPFTLKTADGQQYETGKGSERTIIHVKDDVAEIEQRLGNGSVITKLSADSLALDTLYELAAIALPKTPDNEMKLATAGFIAAQKNLNPQLVSRIRAHLDAAFKNDKLASKAAFLKERLGQYEHDVRAEVAYKKFEALAKGQKWDEARKAAEAYEKEFGASRGFMRLKPQFETRCAEIDEQLTAAALKTRGVYWLESGPEAVLVIEAEHFHAKSDKAPHAWVPVTGAEYTGGAAMQAQPNAGAALTEKGYATTSSRLDYKIHVVKAGRVEIWVRGFGASDEDDTCHIGWDGVELKEGLNVHEFGPEGSWSRLREGNSAINFETKSAGLHTLNVWMREDGFIIDKLILNAKANPVAPQGEGPPESALKPSK